MTNAPFDRSTSGDALAVAAILLGTPGDDELEAVGDGDILRGYAGRDLLTSAFNATELYGDADDDVLVTDVTVSGGEEGAAEVSALQDGGSGDDRLTVDARALARFGPAEIDLTLRGGLGDDVIQAFASIASFTDAVIVGDIDGGQGDDTIGVQMEVEAETNAMPLRTRGGSGDDSISIEAWNTAAFFGGDVATRTLGDAGDDMIQVEAFVEARGWGGAVETIVDGGEGDDRITARSGGGAAGQTNLLWGRNGADVILSDQEAQGAQSPSFRATLDGGGGRDRLAAVVRAGHESLNPDVATSLRGGAGDDALSVSALLTAETFYFPSVVNTLSGGDGADTLRAEIAMTGLIYDGGSIRVENLLSGGLGADRLQVVGGLDNILDGGQGADVMIGGTGDDTYYVDDAGDVTFESGVASGGADVVYSLVDHRLGQGIERLVLLSLATTGIGNGRDNEITGNRMANTLHGYGRDDLLSGLGGRDLLYGGDGNDHVIGGDGDDEVKGGAGDDLLEGGAGNNLVVGGTGADRMFGGDGQDLLDGGEGNDVIDGGDGIDVVLGGAGDDRVSGQGEIRGGAGDDWASGDGSVYGDAGDDLLQGSALSGGAGDDRLESTGDFANFDGGAGVDTLVIDLAKPARFVITIESAADVLEFHGIEDAGAPGLLDDLDGRATFVYDEFESDFLLVAIGSVQLFFEGIPTETDSFADIVDDPATQLVVGEDALI